MSEERKPGPFNHIEPHGITNELLQLCGNFLLQIDLKLEPLQGIKHNSDLLNVLDLPLLNPCNAHLPVLLSLLQRLQVESVLKLILKHRLEQSFVLAHSGNDFLVRVLLLDLRFPDQVLLAFLCEFFLLSGSHMALPQIASELREKVICFFLLRAVRFVEVFVEVEL